MFDFESTYVLVGLIKEEEAASAANVLGQDFLMAMYRLILFSCRNMDISL